MVGVQHKLTLGKIMSQVLGALNNSVKFHVICKISRSGVVQLLIEEGDKASLLAKDNTYYNMWDAAINCEDFLKI